MVYTEAFVTTQFFLE